MTEDKYREALKQAALGIQRLKERLEPLERAAQAWSEPLAIVGLGCRFPGGADDPAAFWSLLDAGEDGIRALDERWALVGAAPAGDVPRWAGLLAGPVDEFDAAFFGISPREARALDPQHRLLLEVSWEALEDAGVPPLSLQGSRTGVFIGAIHNDYAELVHRQPDSARDAYAGTGTMLSIAAGRLSYTLGLLGPCLTVDTACSASLVSIHLAARSLRTGECDLALAGGVQLLLSPRSMETAARLQALAPDGRCKTFDALANGFARGEGCGVVVLKRLSDALRDGDRPWAVLRGSAVNQDGRSTGLTAPNVLAQEALLREALKDAGVAPQDIGFVEAHGTGTALGDPIEVEALRAVLGGRRTDGAQCVLGAVKTNLGHLEAAAGVAGLIKTALALHHERIPRNLGFRTRNPRLRLEHTALALATSPAPWPRGARRRLAGVSSFGLSGTNAHVVLEEAPVGPERAGAPARPWELCVLSARSPVALQAAAARLAAALGAAPTPALGDLAFSLATTRSHLEHRLALVASSVPGLREALSAAAQGQSPATVLRGRAAPRGALAFLFPGQGAQRLGMGRGLYEAFPAFQGAFDQCAELLDPQLPLPLRAVLWASPGSAEAALLDQTVFTQPALFVVGYALYALWQSFGVQPALLAGHSIGEVVAACVGGVLSLPDALTLVAARGRLMQALPPGGAMVSVAAAEAQVAAELAAFGGQVAVAAVNGPEQVVLSGAAEAVAAVTARLVALGVRSKALPVSHAFHSPLMEPMLAPLRQVAESLSYREPVVPIISTVSGRSAGGEMATAEYWVEQARAPVRFAAGVAGLGAAGAGSFVELGPRATLLGLVSAGLPGAEPLLVPSLRHGTDEATSVLMALGALHVHGVPLDWGRLFPAGGRRVSLPTYPWQRQRYWIEDRPATAAPAAAPVDDWCYRIAWTEVSRSAGPGAQVPHWLVVDDPGSAGDEVAAALRAQGQPCTVMATAAATVALERRAAPPGGWHGVLYIGGAAALADDAALETAAGATRQGTAGVLRLVHALGMLQRPPRLWVITRGACAVDDQAPAAPWQAALWGLCRVVAVEHPNLWGGLIDLDPHGDPLALDGLLTALLAPDREDQVALRRGRCWAPRLLSAPPPEPAAPLELSPQASYLITGGLGTLGWHLAQWLVERGARHLLLTGRRGADTPGAAEAIARLAAQGARVRAVAVDCADPQGMAALLSSIEPPLRGVLHAAGVVEDRLLAFQDEAALDRVLRPKADGAWLLHTLTRAQPLDLFVLFSSFAAVAGTAGQGAYAAGNAFLDALAALRRSRGLPALSIGWGLWAEGMGTPAQRREAEDNGMSALPTQPALAALARLLATGAPHRVVARLDRGRFTEAAAYAGRGRLFAGLRGAGPASEQEAQRPVTRRSAADLQALLPGLVRERVADVLGHADPEALDAERGFTEQGMDSLMAVQIRNRLQQDLGLPLSATVAFDYPTLHALVAHLQGRLRDGADPAAAPVTPAKAPDDAVAIVGAACRFPGGVDDLEALWRLLAGQGITATEAPPERWTGADAPAAEGASDQAPVTRGGFLRDLQSFDAGFFRISPREAVTVEPQQRLLLESSWEALEHAGLDPATLRDSRTGVFVGLGQNEYAANQEHADDASRVYAATGGALSFTAGRLSFILGLHGPSLAVDTACSSSLVALHLACQSLRNGECERALAGGVNVLLSWRSFAKLARLRALSPDGRCKTFSSEADGYGRAEGCAVLVLERLADARRRGSRILAVVRGTAVNHDGPSSGLTVPNGPAQQAVVRQALAQAGVAPAEVDFVECHGTGTALGDPIEVQALGAVYGPGRPPDRPLLLGAVKANLGHLEPAAGLAGVLKVVAALAHEQIPAQPALGALNQHIPWEALPVAVVREPAPWPRGGRPRRAGVSSFGLSGTNAHAVLEEAPPAEAPAAAPQRSAELLVLSGRSTAAVDAAAGRLAQHVAAHPELGLGDLAFSLATTRGHLEQRLALAVTSREALLEALAEAAQGQTPAGAARARSYGRGAPKVVFVFPGQGGQWLGMGRQLLAEEPAFRASLEAADRALQAEAGWSLLEVLQAPEPSALERIDVVQPVLFAMEVALAALWRAWGIEPAAVVGHSMGEVAAAHVAGALTLADAMAIMCRRSRLLRRLSGLGEMALVELSLAEAEAAIAGHRDRLSVAVSNGPRSTVLSGDPAALAEVMGALEAREIFCRRVKVDVASHSPQVDALGDDLLAALAPLAPRPAAIPMRSTVTGALLAGPELAAAYWMDNLRQPVRFGQAVAALLADGHSVFVEMSPHPVLTQVVEEARQAAGGKGAAVASTRRGQPERAALLESLGALYVSGCRIAWDGLFPSGGRAVPLPAYPWQRQRHWIDVPAAHSPVRAGGHPLLGRGRAVAALAGVRLWETQLDRQRLPWLAEHRVQGAELLPVAAYLEVALAAGAEALPGVPLVVTDVAFLEAMAFGAAGAIDVQVVTTEVAPGRLAFQIAGTVPGAEPVSWTVHARGEVGRAEEVPASPLEVDAVRARCGPAIGADEVYAALAAAGMTCGPAFQGVESFWPGAGEALGRIRLPEAGGSPRAYQVHPALLDAGLQVMAGAVMAEASADTPRAAWVPVALSALRLRRPVPAGPLWCHARVQPSDDGPPDRRRADLVMADAAGVVVAEISGLTLQRRSAGLPEGVSAAEPAPPSGAEEGGLLVRVASTPPADRAALLRDFLRAASARVLRLPERSVTADVPLVSLGMDSLMGLELQHRIMRETGVRVPMTRLLRGATLDHFVQVLLERLPTEPLVSGHEVKTWLDAEI